MGSSYWIEGDKKEVKECLTDKKMNEKCVRLFQSPNME